VLVERLSANPSFTGDREKVLTLSGYTSGLILLIFAGMIIAGAIGRFINPRVIEYREAILIAFVGLGVNILSAFLLHHDHDDGDTNIRAAYLHVLADAVTSVAAIAGLAVAMVWGLPYIDAIAALVSSAVIIRWSISLLRDAGRELIS
jgi:cation diffusion facilitator family transporter